MKRQWINEELIANFTISAKELDLIGDSKTDHNLLGAACLLKYFQYEGRFPDEKQDIPPIVIVHLAQQLGVIPEKIIPYDWEGRTIKAHRAAIRAFLGVHETTLGDEEALVEWLCQEVAAGGSPHRLRVYPVQGATDRPAHARSCAPPGAYGDPPV